MRMTSRKKPGVAFWASVVVGAMVLYAASFGPACWITSHFGRGASLIPTIYRPLMAMMRIGEEKERRQCAAYSWMIGRPEKVPVVPDGSLAQYASLGAPAGWHWRYCAIYTIRTVPVGDARIRLRDEEWQWSGGP
jgi:hypothetical protein